MCHWRVFGLPGFQRPRYAVDVLVAWGGRRYKLRFIRADAGGGTGGGFCSIGKRRHDDFLDTAAVILSENLRRSLVPVPLAVPLLSQV